MIQIIGDGSFYFNVSDSVFAVSKQYKLPILTIVLDNGGWSAVKESTLRVYPDGDARTEDDFSALLAADVDFSKVGEAFGAYGEKLTDPAQVPAAIERCAARGPQRPLGGAARVRDAGCNFSSALLLAFSLPAGESTRSASGLSPRVGLAEELVLPSPQGREKWRTSDSKR